MDNLPDDWNCYWRTCPEHGRYHASEGCDGCAEEEEQEEQEEDEEESEA